MKKLLFIGLGLLFLIQLLACSNTLENNTTIDAEIVNNRQSSSSDEAQAVLSIQGMMCEIACAGKIRKDLSSLEGVSLVEITYDENNPVDIAKVNYNTNLLSEEDLINCVQQIADGELYHVKKVEVNDLSSSNGSNSANSSDGTSSMAVDFKLPGLWDVIRYFIPSY